MNHRRYIAWYRSTARVVFETLRAAGSRPYGGASGPVVPTMRNVVLPVQKNVKPFPGGEGLLKLPFGAVEEQCQHAGAHVGAGEGFVGDDN